MEKLTVAHEWLNRRGGAETVIQQTLSTLNCRELWTAAAHPSWRDRREYTIRAPISLNNDAEYAELFRSIDLGIGHAAMHVAVPRSDILVRSHHHFSGFFEVNARREIVYVHAVPRLWWNPNLVPWERKLISNTLWTKGRDLDYLQAQRANVILCNGELTRSRIARYYGRDDATVLTPPLTSRLPRSPTTHGDYIATVARLVEGKRLTSAIDAFRRTDVVWNLIGSGRDHDRLLSATSRNSNIRILGDLPSSSMRRVVREAKAVLNLGQEEFGITVHEALLAQKPVIVAEDSEAAKIVHELQCGYVVKYDDPQGIRDAIASLDALDVDWPAVKGRLAQFDISHFRDALLTLVGVKNESR